MDRGWHIERLETGAWERLRTIRLRALADAPDAFATTLAEAEARGPAHWRGRLEDPRGVTFLGVAGGRDVGLVMGNRYEGRDGAAGLFGMWVAPEFRGRGIGGALVDAVVAWARAGEYERLLLDVGDRNLSAIRLYESRGFLPTGGRSALPPPREHVTDHERALILSRVPRGASRFP